MKRKSSTKNSKPAKKLNVQSKKSNPDLIEWIEASDSRESTQVSFLDTSSLHRPTDVPTLQSICVNVVAHYIKKLANPAHPDFFRFRLLPPVLLKHLSHALKDTPASDLTIELIRDVFLSADLWTISLSDFKWVDIKAINLLKENAFNHGGSLNVRQLFLNNQHHLSDTVLPKLLVNMPHLERLELRGCVKIGDKTVVAAANHCSRTLKHLNINFTSTTAVGVEAIFELCEHLTTIKLAGLSSITDNRWALIANKIPTNCRSNLLNLKLRATKIGNRGIAALLSHHASSLQNLDISFTQVTRFQTITNCSSLQKLNFTGTKIRVTSDVQFSNVFLQYLSSLNGSLHTLLLGEILVSDANMAVIAPTLAGLTRLSLFDNYIAGGPGLYALLYAVAPTLRILNLYGTRVSAQELGALAFFETGGNSVLEELDLGKVKVGDEIGPILVNCKNLTRLFLNQTLVTETSVRAIIASCSKLSYLDLTGCRGIDVKHRRNFFERAKQSIECEDANE